MARRIIARSASVTSPTKLTSSASCWASKRRGYVENGLCLCEQECQPPASATGGVELGYFFRTLAKELHVATSQASPYAPLIPEQRWFPADETMRDTAYDKLIPPLVAKVREEIYEWRNKAHLPRR